MCKHVRGGVLVKAREIRSKFTRASRHVFVGMHARRPLSAVFGVGLDTLKPNVFGADSLLRGTAGAYNMLTANVAGITACKFAERRKILAHIGFNGIKGGSVTAGAPLPQNMFLHRPCCLHHLSLLYMLLLRSFNAVPYNKCSYILCLALYMLVRIAVNCPLKGDLSFW
ncbi:hypothetical protein AC579_2619 [Pseudocercospora musae]|uniref:Uncharacterized protein n=1 Tax=Pseudocercospora musae TaxID=113226 RepID=A0A139HV28_9PEZI|nr:hypothetical protein AC579_2619 [Pseudocercospora musae]